MSGVKLAQQPADVARSPWRELGDELVVATPLGLAKPCALLDALYVQAQADGDKRLTILTALSLTRPRAGNPLGERLLAPIVARSFGGWRGLRYAEDAARGVLPDNVRVEEFCFQPGAARGRPRAQRHHVATSYTNVLRDLFTREVNVFAGLLAVDEDGRLSFGSNPDLGAEALDRLDAARRAGRRTVAVAEQSHHLPFVGGDARVSRERFDILVEPGEMEQHVPAPPDPPITTREHAIGLLASALVPDGGTLQVGIGGVSNAVTQALILRHRDNARWRAALRAVGGEPIADLAQEAGGVAPFQEGLYACTELLVGGFLGLYDAGVLKRRVYDDEELQPRADEGARAEGGAVLHAGFFLGPRALQERLRNLSEREARELDFVEMAHQLPDGRSLLRLPSVHEREGTSNIVLQVSTTTVPRHLRDLVVTEHGVADLRGKNDGEVAAALIAVADPAHREELAREARNRGLLPESFQPSAPPRGEGLGDALRPFREDGTLEDFPFDDTLDHVEQELAVALRELDDASVKDHLRDAPSAAHLHHQRHVPDELLPHLRRLGLEHPTGVRERAQRRLAVYALSRAGLVEDEQSARRAS